MMRVLFLTGFNLEEIDGYGDIWDLGGQPKIRHLWKHYYDRIWVIIFVVDSTDGARLDNKGGDNGSVQQSSMELINGLLFSLNRENSESVLGDDVTDISGGYPSYQHPTAKEELHRLMKEDELRNAVLLIFANKQDLPNAMSINEITARLELNKLRNRSWYIVGTSAIEPFGLREGLNWLKRKQSD